MEVDVQNVIIIIEKRKRMCNVFTVENIRENNDYVVFFKIIEKKYMDKFQNDGQVYFGLLKDYRKIEKNGHEEIGDSFEASLTQKVQLYIEIQDGKYEEVHGKETGNSIIMNAKQCAFCFYALGLKRFDKISEMKFIHKIPTGLLEKLCKDKGGIENCAIMIFDDEFIHKIIDEIKKRKLSYMSRKVSYDDYDYIPQFDIHSKEYTLESCFHKRKKYDYQNEFRIVALNTKDEPIKDLYVDVSPNQLQFIELKYDSDFVCEINLNAQEIGKICNVYFDISCSLDSIKYNS